MIKVVQAISGPVLSTKLGHCQPHEHIMVRPGPATAKNPALLIDSEERSLQELMSYRFAGGSSLIDCQPVGAGRDVAALRRLSEKSGISIIAVTGYHLPVFYRKDHMIFTADEEALYEYFFGELHAGIVVDGRLRPSFCAGAVKAAMDENGPKGRTRTLLRAAARAAAKAGVPLILHTERGLGGVEAVQLCKEMGLPPRKVLVCHVDRQAEDYTIHEAIAQTGAMLEYDTIGRPKYHDDHSEALLIAHMLDKGYGKQLLLSLDTTRERLLSYGGTVGLSYLLEGFLPYLRSQGLAQEQLTLMTRENPARIFA